MASGFNGCGVASKCGRNAPVRRGCSGCCSVGRFQRLLSRFDVWAQGAGRERFQRLLRRFVVRAQGASVKRLQLLLWRFVVWAQGASCEWRQRLLRRFDVWEIAPVSSGSSGSRGAS